MANVKISDLTAYVDPASSDILPIVDLVNDVTKKVTIADLLENAGDGSAAAPAFAFNSDSNTGIYRSGADELSFATAGTQRLVISSSGVVSINGNTVLTAGEANSVTSAMIVDGTIVNADINASAAIAGTKVSPNFGSQNVLTTGSVGVGTSSPTSGNVGAKFIHIHNTATDANRPSEIVFTNGSTGTAGGSGGTVTYYQDDLYFWNYENQDLIFGTNATERMRINSSGNIGIGTTSPSKHLVISSGGAAGMEIGAGNGSANGGTLIEHYNRSSSAYVQSRTIASDFVLNAGSNTFVINSSGNVGIGTTSPAAELEVASSSAQIRITDTDSASSGNCTLEFAFSGGRNGYVGYGGSNALYLWNELNNNVIFGANNSEAMRIDSSGNVGIGNSSPAYKVSVLTTGTSDTSLHLATTGGGSANGDATNSVRFTGGTNTRWANAKYEAFAHIFNVNGTEKMRIDSSGRVGIGVSPSTFNGNGDNLVISSSSHTGLTIDATSSTNSSIHFADGSTGNEAYRGYLVYQHSSDSMQFATSATERLRIDSSGNVFIGGTTASSADIALNANGTITAVGIVQSGGDPDNGTANGAQLRSAGTIYASRGANKAIFSGYTTGDTSPKLSLYSDGSITAAGDVSINSDKVKLYSGGQIDVYNSTTNAANQLLKIKSDIGGSGTVNASIFADGSATFAGDVTGQSVIGNRSTGGNAVFAGKQNGTQTTRINADGSATFAGTVNSGANPDNGANNGAYMGPGYIAVSRNGGNIFTGYKTGTSSPNVEIISNGNATFAGSITASNVSDIRFKENITDANPQLADAVALGSQLKNFDWNDDAPLNEELRAKRFLGLVAQEAEKVCPGLTYTVPRTKQGKELTPAVLDEEGNETKAATYEELDDSYKAINHDILVMKLLGAVAELSAEVAALKAG